MEGFTQTQISTLAVNNDFLVAGGFQGELACKVICYKKKKKRNMILVKDLTQIKKKKYFCFSPKMES